jgi:hypothetical protein
MLKISRCGSIAKLHVWGLFKNVQMQGEQKTEPRGVYRYTLSGAVCSATQQMSIFQQSSDNIFVDTFITFPYKLWAKYRGKTGDVP